MTTHHRLYTRPLGLWSIELPLLQVTGALPSHVAGAAYEGRLPITGNVGDCTVEWLTGELPPGATVTVDNATAEVVVAWPAYVPEFTTAFLNGDFEQGNLGWLATAGWRIDTYADWPAFGAIAIYDGAGPGIMESVAMPCSPGQTITARGLWGQGPSNKKNINLWTCLIWRDENRNVLNDLSTINADGFYREEEPWVGNKVHDQANGQQHWSTVTDTAPPGTAYAAVRHAVHRRRYQRQVEVYKTEWNLPRQLGSADVRDWCITLRVRDSAGRSADWSGCIYENAIIYTSPPYIADAGVEGVSASAGVEASDMARELYDTAAEERIAPSVAMIDVTLRAPLVTNTAEVTAVKCSAAVTAMTLRVTQVQYFAPVDAELLAGASTVGLTLDVVLITTEAPIESLSAAAAVTGVTLA